MSKDFEAWKGEHSPDRKEVPVCFDRALLFEVEKAAKDVAEIAGEQKGNLSEVAGLRAAEDRLDELREQVKAKEHVLVFESIGMKAWRDLLSEHPPPEDERHVVTFLGLPIEWDSETFPQAAMSATCVEPGITLEQATWFCSTFPVGEVDRVFGAVLTCNVTGLERPFGDTGSPLLGAKRLTPPSS